ncbi:MAG: heavy-metal-associated domain-containing protein [Oscillibacter sp.]|nr:heavy-metal-associated domain-containing protein [Oscillibacter sp.]
MKIISVPDMMCSSCVKRITDALRAAGLSFTVSLEQKSVSVEGAPHCVETAVSVLEDLGFTPKVL